WRLSVRNTRRHEIERRHVGRLEREARGRRYVGRQRHAAGQRRARDLRLAPPGPRSLLHWILQPHRLAAVPLLRRGAALFAGAVRRLRAREPAIRRTADAALA